MTSLQSSETAVTFPGVEAHSVAPLQVPGDRFKVASFGVHATGAGGSAGGAVQQDCFGQNTVLWVDCDRKAKSLSRIAYLSRWTA